MRLLLDENIEPVIAAWLREEGHDVLHAAESMPSAHDPTVARRAAAEGRVVLTYDRDFGELAIRFGVDFVGVIFLRLGQGAAAEKLIRIRAIWPQAKTEVAGHFLTIDWHKVRRRPLNDL